MKDFTVLVPKFLDVNYNILDFDAKEGGLESNTKAIQNAIDKAHLNGGGKVIIPKGLWLTGPIKLKSNVNLHLEKSAFLLFDKNEEEYPLIITEWEGEKRVRTVSPISAFDAENIAITGLGTIDGNGDLWRPIKKWKLTDKHFEEKLRISSYTTGSGDKTIWYPNKSIYEGYLEGEVLANEDNALAKAQKHYDLYRPSLVNIVRCDKVLIEGVIIQNSPAWNVHPLYTTNLTLRNVSIKNDYSAQNGDGLDIESCKNVEIDNCIFNVGDDGICVKAGKGREARQLIFPTENVYIHDCIVHQAHGGFVVGSETSRGIKNVYVKDCNFIGTDIGIRFKSALGRGGVIEDITLENIKMFNIKEEAIIFTMGYVLFNYDKKSEADLKEVLQDDIPEFKNIKILNSTCINAKKALEVNGLDVLPINNITLENVTIVSEEKTSVKNGHNIIMKNVRLINQNDRCDEFYYALENIGDVK